jgi:hypothetical protein
VSKRKKLKQSKLSRIWVSAIHETRRSSIPALDHAAELAFCWFDVASELPHLVSLTFAMGSWREGIAQHAGKEGAGWEVN